MSFRRVLKRRLRRVVKRIGRARPYLPGWVNRILDWLRWHIPASWVLALGGRPYRLPDGTILSVGAVKALLNDPAMHRRPAPPDTDVRVLIGPTNYAGQGNAWMRAVERSLPGVGGVCFALEVPGGFDFPDDFSVPPLVYRRSRRWQRDQFRYIAEGFTHVITEAARPLCADLYHLDPFHESEALVKRGLRVAMLSHGTDSRNPRAHAERFEWSPYRDPEWEAVPVLQQQTDDYTRRLESFDGPVYVSTPDLIDYIPRGVWCPVVVDVERWRSDAPVLEADRPVVVHAPSRSHIKGSDLVDAAMTRLHDAGIVEYRRIERVPSAEMPGVYTRADIVLDQFLLGSYGVAASEAMAAGRVVVGNVAPEVRSRVLELSGAELPVVQADPSEIAEVVEHLARERVEGRRAAAAGPEFVDRVHTGEFSARALRPFLIGDDV